MFDFFLSNLYPLDVLCCLIALARISSTMLNRYEESRQHCFVTDFSEIALSFSTFKLMLAFGLLYITLLCLDMFLVYLFSPRPLS